MPLRWDPWNEVAVALDGSVAKRGRLASSEFTIRSTVAGVDVVAKGKSVPFGGGSFTRVAAVSTGLRELRVHVGPPDAKGPWRLHKVWLDDRIFGQTRVAYANDPGLARTWLDTETKTLITSSAYSFVLRGGTLTASRPELEDDADGLEHVIRTVAHLSGRGGDLRRDWLAMAEDGRVEGTGRDKDGLAQLQTIIIRHGAADVTIEPFFGVVAARRHGKRFFTRLSCARRGHELDTYVVHPSFSERSLRPKAGRGTERLSPPNLDRWNIHCQNPDRMRGRIRPPLPEMIERSGLSVIVATRQLVSVYLAGLACEHQQLRAALALTARLAVEIDTEAVGPYR